MVVVGLGGAVLAPAADGGGRRLAQDHITFALGPRKFGRMEWLKKVVTEIPADATTFAYNRPGYGYGNGDPVTTPRDGVHIVDELCALLRSQSPNPPYILVGQSLGGLHMRWFARCHPDEVIALALDKQSISMRRRAFVGSLTARR